LLAQTASHTIALVQGKATAIFSEHCFQGLSPSIVYEVCLFFRALAHERIDTIVLQCIDHQLRHSVTSRVLALAAAIVWDMALVAGGAGNDSMNLSVIEPLLALCLRNYRLPVIQMAVSALDALAVNVVVSCLFNLAG
jgi:hypothetical protein